MNERLINTVWTEKYRPQTIADCILPQELHDLFTGMIEADDVQNMIFTGTAGIGKTTVAKALAKEVGCDVMVINGSDESGIDVLRTKIKDFATTVSLANNNKPKIVIIDEADYLNPQSTQPALRSFMEEFSKNCRFIMTCNYAKRIIEPLHSRATVINFKIDAADKKKIITKFYKRAEFILKSEKVEFNAKALASLVIRNFPDFRKTINTMQKYNTAYGNIDEGCLGATKSASISHVMAAMKSKDFGKIRKWINEYIDQDVNVIYREIFDSLVDYMPNASIPQAILIIDDKMGSMNPDQEISMSACFIELMLNCEFK